MLDWMIDEIPGRRAYISVTAYHEAGHAIAGLWQGIWVEKVDVYHHTPGNGQTTFDYSGLVNPFDPNSSPGVALVAWQTEYDMTLRLKRVLLAGPLAEAKFLGKPLRSLGAKSDLDKSWRLLRHLYEYWKALPPDVGIEWPGGRIINQTREEVRRWVGHPSNWRKIHRIAMFVQHTRALNARELCSWLSSTEGSEGQGTLRF